MQMFKNIFFQFLFDFLIFYDFLNIFNRTFSIEKHN